ncbi:unnamed protein product [Mytilus coruscus]|uniref:CCHC-type domain-containing protein n=1 Tax=Mytilus coruscus TaxID=42192 RepID=A0A6J8B0Y0_MYTCO|nr:unnamed protein product [Mytilus coruscus]
MSTQVQHCQRHSNVRNTPTLKQHCQRPSNVQHILTLVQQCPEIQQRPNYLQYPNNSTVPNWLPRQQYSGSQQQHSDLQNFENSKQDNGRRTRVPFCNGRDPWNVYFMQFELIAEINRWDTDTKAIELVTALKDEAMVNASYHSPETKRFFSGLCADMSNRFGDRGYPETYRQELHTLRKQGRESIHEYASRVEMLVRRSFPTIDAATHSTLIVEITDKEDYYYESIHQVTLYETYKRGNRDRNIRQITTQDTVDSDEFEDDVEIRKIGGKRYDTEERLAQFERGMKDSITQSVGEIIQKEMTKYHKPEVNQSHRQNQQFNKDNRTKSRTTRCFNCNAEGHYIRDCPKEKRSPIIKKTEVVL